MHCTHILKFHRLCSLSFFFLSKNSTSNEFRRKKRNKSFESDTPSRARIQINSLSTGGWLEATIQRRMPEARNRTRSKHSKFNVVQFRPNYTELTPLRKEKERDWNRDNLSPLLSLSLSSLCLAVVVETGKRASPFLDPFILHPFACFSVLSLLFYSPPFLSLSLFLASVLTWYFFVNPNAVYWSEALNRKSQPSDQRRRSRAVRRLTAVGTERAHKTKSRQRKADRH